MSLSRTQHPKAALERTVFEEAANCAVTPPRGEGWTPRSSLYKNSEIRLLDFVGVFRLFLFFILTLCGSPANWFCMIVEWLWGMEPKVVGSAFTPSSMGSDHRILKSLAVTFRWSKELSLRHSKSTLRIDAIPRNMKTCQLYQLFSCASVTQEKYANVKKQKKPHHLQRWKAWIIHKSGETLK